MNNQILNNNLKHKNYSSPLIEELITNVISSNTFYGFPMISMLDGKKYYCGDYMLISIIQVKTPQMNEMKKFTLHSLFGSLIIVAKVYSS